MLERLFALKAHQTTVRTEVLAGITTFMTMAYILAVNPMILSACGMDAGAVFTATAVSAVVATVIMALAANLPVALAPGMGLNAFFAFSVVMGMGHSWQFALTAVFLEGIIFILLTLTNLREAILDCIPAPLKKGISGGIGLFIAFIGLQSAGVVVKNDATLVGMGPLATPGVLVAVVGMAVAAVLLCRKTRGALLLGILAATLVGIPLGVTKLAQFSAGQLFVVPSLGPTFWQFEWSQIFTLDMVIVLFTFLFVDLFDTVGTLIAVTTKAGLTDAEGRLPQARNAFLADAIGTTVGAVLGTSTVTSFVESASGVAEGGRTGLTALTVAGLFACALFVAPLFLLIPAQATASALILVGLFMLSPIVSADWDDYVHSVPLFLTLIIMPLTYSIAHGIAFGVISYVLLAFFAGRRQEVPALTSALAVLFVLKFLWG